jgi:hypothetical protein
MDWRGQLKKPNCTNTDEFGPESRSGMEYRPEPDQSPDDRGCRYCLGAHDWIGQEEKQTMKLQESEPKSIAMTEAIPFCQNDQNAWIRLAISFGYSV